MKVLVTGGTGFIGTPLIQKLLEVGNTVVLLAKHQPPSDFGGRVAFYPWDALLEEPPQEALYKVDAIIHLAGENIFGLWTKKRKKLIFDSRKRGTQNLVLAIKKAATKPKVLISASAVGYYGDKGEEEITEEGLPGNDFLARVCNVWEREARTAEALGLRTVQIRTAPVLGQGGMLAKMLPAFKLGLGASFGSGKQWFPWIHLEDIVRVYLFVLENDSIDGPVNACAPNPATNQDFTQLLARVLHRPAFFRVPAPVLRGIMGEAAGVVLASQKAYPKKLLEAGFVFKFQALEQALNDVVKY